MPFLKAPEYITGIVLMSGRQLDTVNGMVETDNVGEMDELRGLGYVLLSDEDAEALLEADEPIAPLLEADEPIAPLLEADEPIAPPAADKKPSKK